jgi:UDP-N-acetylglucosamine 1-carboxyvinyltransferase
MDAIEIRGGRPLTGTVDVSGSKNAALPLLAATLLAEGTHNLENVPRLADINTTIALLRHMGCEVERPATDKFRTLQIGVGRNLLAEAPYDLVKTMRASVLVLGPLVARLGKARVSLPGGCAIGARPIDQHLKGLTALGAEIRLEHGYVEALAPKGLRGGTIVFDMPTVTGTENLLMAAALARGRTTIENAAREPEIVELAEALNSMGAKITGIGTPVLTIDGVEGLRPLQHTVGPDRIEAGTLVAAAAITGGDVIVRRCRLEHLDAVAAKLREAGVKLEPVEGGVRVKGPAQPQATDFRTAPYPGFPTDMQAQMMTLLTVASGSSVIHETVFENRFMHVLELGRMGADIRVDGHTAVVKGVKALSGAPVMATDLRASASLVIAGLRAEGVTTVQRVYHLDRGYERLEEKLAQLGADTRRFSEQTVPPPVRPRSL